MAERFSRFNEDRSYQVKQFVNELSKRYVKVLYLAVKF